MTRVIRNVGEQRDRSRGNNIILTSSSLECGIIVRDYLYREYVEYKVSNEHEVIRSWGGVPGGSPPVTCRTYRPTGTSPYSICVEFCVEYEFKFCYLFYLFKRTTAPVRAKGRAHMRRWTGVAAPHD